MTRAQAVLATLLAYQVTLLAIGLWASRRTSDDTDFFLGGRRLGPWVAAISASASSSSAWTLLGVSGAAFTWGLSALWLFPATVSGFVVNWLWVGPRLMRMSRERGSVTLTEFLADTPEGVARGAITRFASGAILIAFLFYIASQFQGAGNAFAASFGLSANTGIAIGAAIVVLYTLLGGFWAVSVTDLLQGLLMAVAAVLLPAVALAEVGGLGALREGLRQAHDGSAGLHLTRGFPGVLGLLFVLGTLGIGLGYPGQPHVVNRYMALRDESALRRGRIIAIAWAVVIYAGMLLLGLSARVLFAGAPDGEQVLFHTANALLPPALAGVMVAAVLSAIMSTADSQLLVAASAVSWDLRRAGRAAPPPSRTDGLGRSRAVVVALSLLATIVAMAAPAAIFSRVLFAWHALGSAFGPVLLLRLAGRAPDGRAVLASIVTGFSLTVVFYLRPDTPGDWVERLVPFALALLVASVGWRRPGHERGP
jgi:sodium/proline symporter